MDMEIAYSCISIERTYGVKSFLFHVMFVSNVVLPHTLLYNVLCSVKFVKKSYSHMQEMKDYILLLQSVIL